MFKDKIVDFYLDKSLAYCRIFKIKKAIETVNKALWLDKNNVEALITRGFFIPVFLIRKLLLSVLI
ncbi:hypothetical protein [Methanobrevibacter oralis]|uniref:hypothetical protein n=1 Tax=Methanobrevibacter oralis TaxID=66851 RepID=UPI0005B2EA29|nr:hypothetical protein [Methanobrevibacter oralis]